MEPRRSPLCTIYSTGAVTAPPHSHASPSPASILFLLDGSDLPPSLRSNEDASLRNPQRNPQRRTRRLLPLQRKLLQELLPAHRQCEVKRGDEFPG
ncbi:hypothetical protein NDU88_004788 [Pleurodeles waltl]|uniref:Uncharacterized protein n=1 Tax=Pleurodeles waltl TaxID=8319 RepID=A0AAV7SJT8_PLEWA|nr:hypothetical protein NDU88_004788 [Pleurodeles waltl]